MMTVDIWHNLLWSKYKGAIFSELYKLAVERGAKLRFFQIAATDSQRINLVGVDLRYHTYPFELVFEGSYDAVSRWRLYGALAKRIVTSPALIVVLAGYHRPEFWLQLVLARLMGKRVAVFCDSTLYDRPQSSLKRVLKRLFFARCHRVFCYGQRTGKYIESFGVPRDRIVTGCQAAALPLGYVPDEALLARLASAPWRDAPRFLYVGRLSVEKDLLTLLKAFAIVVMSSPNAILRIVGSGPQRAELEAAARTSGIADKVVFAGSRSNEALYGEYSAATCLVLPSRSEPWGLVVNEALAYGCPVIVSDHCGCVPELVLEGVTGFSFVCGNADDLADRMQRILPLAQDVEGVAHNALDCVGQFTPKNAARRIFEAGLAPLAGEN